MGAVIQCGWRAPDWCYHKPPSGPRIFREWQNCLKPPNRKPGWSESKRGQAESAPSLLPSSPPGRGTRPRVPNGSCLPRLLLDSAARFLPFSPGAPPSQSPTRRAVPSPARWWKLSLPPSGTPKYPCASAESTHPGSNTPPRAVIVSQTGWTERRKPRRSKTTSPEEEARLLPRAQGNVLVTERASASAVLAGGPRANTCAEPCWASLLLRRGEGGREGGGAVGQAQPASSHPRAGRRAASFGEADEAAEAGVAQRVPARCVEPERRSS